MLTGVKVMFRVALVIVRVRLSSVHDYPTLLEILTQLRLLPANNLDEEALIQEVSTLIWTPLIKIIYLSGQMFGN